MRTERLDGKPVREVPPDWIGRSLPMQDESAKPEIAWWAKHPNGTFTPVYKGSRNFVTGEIE